MVSSTLNNNAKYIWKVATFVPFHNYVKAKGAVAKLNCKTIVLRTKVIESLASIAIRYTTFSLELSFPGG